jgi:uncharacterized protein (TIGR02301 family)
MLRTIAAMIAAVIAFSSAFAAEAPPAPTAPLAESAPPPPYEDQFLRLAEILGALHYLRDLCKAGDGDAWRQQMEALITSEQPDDLRRARMVDRFNHGYDGFRSVYLTCTPAASLASDRYLQEGAKIAADITARYGK